MVLRPAALFVPLALAMAFASSAFQVPAAGSVGGVVLREDGQPLAGATVCGLPEQDMGHQIRTTADVQGKFLLEQVPAGGVYLLAFKETEWYPYNFFSFFSSGPQPSPKVAVGAGKITDNAVIHLGPPAGALNIEVVDQSGTALSEGVNRDDIPGEYRRGAAASTYLLLVPAVPFHMTVEAPGYEPWHSGVIKPESRKALNVVVRLKPTS